MKGINRVVAAAVIASVTLAACGTDPMGPGSGVPQLFTVGATDAFTVGGTPLPMPSHGCASTVEAAEDVLSGSSTYVVAYGDVPVACPPPAPPEASPIVPLSPVAPDSLPFRPTPY